MEQTLEIDIKEIFAALLRKIWMVILAAVIGVVLFYGYTAYFVTPMYRASVSIYVNNTNAQSQSGITSSDLATSQKLVNTYVNILKSDRVLDKVIKAADLDLSASEVRKMLEASAMNGTEMFQVDVSNPDPEVAAEIANAITTVAPAEIAEIVVGSSTKIVDHAKIPEKPYAPNRMRNAVIGGVVGVLLAAVVTVLQVMLDVRIKDEHDLRSISQAPVLGVIPNFDMEPADGYEYQTKKTKPAGGSKEGVR